MSERQLRAVRGAAAAAVAVLLAAISHTAGGADAPAAAILLATLVLAWPVCTLLVGRRLNAAGLALAVLAAQGALHAAYALSVGWMPATTSTAHVHGIPRGSLTADTAAAGAADGLMLGAHLVAALTAFLLLRHGERVARGVVRWALRRTSRALHSPVGRPAPRAPRPRPTDAPSPRLIRLSVIFRRGPPSLSGDLRVA